MVETIYWLQCLRHSICILITKLHLQLVELSKTANINSQYLSTVSSYMWIAKKNMFPQNTIETIAIPNQKKGRRTPDLRLPFTRNECQSVKWKAWYSVFARIPNLPSEQGYTWHLWFAYFPQPSRKKKYLDRKFWELERVAYLAMETDVDRDNVRWSIRETSTTTGNLTIACVGSRVSSWTGNMSGMEEP